VFLRMKAATAFSTS